MELGKMTDIVRAKSLFTTGGYTCVLCKQETILTSRTEGIAPLVRFISEATGLQGYSAADKVVGKAAAMLYVLAGVRDVYATVMSEEATKLFEGHQIGYSFETLTPFITNRPGNDICPMDRLVRDIGNATEAFEAIREKVNQLSPPN
ncbi:MAG: DUF1893 domain-containing protein [Bacteroidota bacterium]|nr:DUF1893 domain-containing protein [Bacteroidota bacterium]